MRIFRGEKKCIEKGVKLTDQRKVIAKVMSDSNDHPNVDELYKRVSIIDPKIRKIVNSNDLQRSIRAYEVKKFTRKSLFDWYKDTKSLFNKDDFVKIYIDCPRDVLLKRIKIRTQKMFKGAVTEVKKIKNMKIPNTNSSNKIIGINAIKDLLEKKRNKQQTIDLIVIKTRQYAKRQATWARGQMKDWKSIPISDKNFSLKKIIY